MTQKLFANGSITVSHCLERADSFWSRFMGLMGRNHFKEGQALWISSCNSIHTFFMKFPIDVLYVNRNHKIVGLQKNARPWRLFAPRFSARSVVELPAGTIDKLGLKENMELKTS